MWSYLAVAAAMVSAATIERCALLYFHRNWFAQGYAGDGAFHLAVVRELKRTGRYGGIPYFLMTDAREPDTYPILFHRFAALFPQHVVEHRAYLPNLVIWITLCTAAALYVHYAATALLDAGGVATAILFIVIFLTLASNLSLESNGLNYIALSERLLARFSCGFCFAGLVVGMTFGDGISYAVATFAGVGALLSSMFARQAVAFVLPVMALIELDPRPLYLLAACFVGAVAVDGRYFLRGLRHMALYFQSYNRVVKHSRFFKPALSRWLNWHILLAPRTSLRERVTEIEMSEPTQLLVRLPELALLVALWITRDHVNPVALDALTAMAVVYLLTTTPYLRQFGEAIRYFEYDAWLLVPLLLAINLTGSDPVPVAMLAAYAIWVALVTARRISVWRNFPLPATDRMRELVGLAGITAESTVFTVPLHLGAEVSARALCRTFNYQGTAVTVELYRRFVEEPPMLKREWKSLAMQFGVTHIVADKRHLQVMPSVLGWAYDFSGLPLLGESGFYVAYEVPAAVLATPQLK